MNHEFSGWNGMIYDGCRREDFQAFGFPLDGDLGESAWPGMVGAQGSFERFGGLGEIEPAVLTEELWSVGGFFGILRGAGSGIVCEDFESFVEGCGAEIGEAIMEFSGGFLGSNGNFFHGNDIPGIEFTDHVHDGDLPFPHRHSRWRTGCRRPHGISGGWRHGD